MNDKKRLTTIVANELIRATTKAILAQEIFYHGTSAANKCQQTALILKQAHTQPHTTQICNQ